MSNRLVDGCELSLARVLRSVIAQPTNATQPLFVSLDNGCGLGDCSNQHDSAVQLILQGFQGGVGLATTNLLDKPCRARKVCRGAPNLWTHQFGHVAVNCPPGLPLAEKVTTNKCG
jgi:hypothetical protein